MSFGLSAAFTQSTFKKNLADSPTTEIALFHKKSLKNSFFMKKLINFVAQII